MALNNRVTLTGNLGGEARIHDSTLKNVLPMLYQVVLKKKIRG